MEHELIREYTSILGPPGTGKTSELIARAREALLSGSPTNRVAFVTYTRKAAREGAVRIGNANQFPYFTTLHALCLKCTDVATERVLNPAQRNPELDGWLKEKLGYGPRSKRGQTAAKIHSLRRMADMSYVQMLDKIFAPRLPPIAERDLDAYTEAYETFKQDNGYIDFDDVLDEFLARGHTPSLDLFLVDEAQDLTSKLWKVVERVAENADHTVLAGDNDQMLYEWAGADNGSFEKYFQTAKVLGQSHRCSMAVAAKANQVVDFVRSIPREWVPTDRMGGVYWIGDPAETSIGRDGESWLVLSRTNRRVHHMAGLLKERCVWYGTVTHGRNHLGLHPDLMRLLRWWNRLGQGLDVRRTTSVKCLKMLGLTLDAGDSDRLTRSELPILPSTIQGMLGQPLVGDFPRSDLHYARLLADFGVDLLSDPQVWIMTINQAKGSEADHVLIDVYATREVRESYSYDLGPETRQAYVALTRARQDVWLYDEVGNALECWNA